MATAELTTTFEAETEDLENQIAPVLREANAITIDSPDSYSKAADFLKSVKEAQKKVSEFFAPMKSATHEAWKKVVAGEKSMLGPLEAAEKAVKQKGVDYQNEEERKRLAEQRRLQAAADEQARKERDRLAKEAAKLKTPELREERLAAAAAVAAPVVSVAPSAPKVAGVAMRTTWKARVLDPLAVPRDYLMVNEKLLDAFAKSTKGSIKVAGVEFYPEQSMAVGSK